MIQLQFDFRNKQLQISAPKTVNMKIAEALVKIQKAAEKKNFRVRFKPIAA